MKTRVFFFKNKNENNKNARVKFLVVELSEEQKQMIILSDDYQRFVMKAGRVMERALWETEDIYTDYIGGGDIDEATYVNSNNFRFYFSTTKTTTNNL